MFRKLSSSSLDDEELIHEELTASGELVVPQCYRIEPPVVKIIRSGPISSRGYYSWREGLWTNVFRLLLRGELGDLSAIYDKARDVLVSQKDFDRAGILMIRKAITLFYNKGHQLALPYLDETQHFLEQNKDQLPNFAFVQGSVHAITVLPLLQQGKLGKAEQHLKLACETLAGAEDCDITSELHFAFAHYYHQLSKRSSGQQLCVNREKAIAHCTRSREICTADIGKGEWYSYYGVEILHLMLLIKTNADEFHSKSDFNSGHKLWRDSLIADVELIIAQIEKEKLNLTNSYVYINLTLAKCKCLIYVQKLLRLDHAKYSSSRKSLETGTKLCEQGIKVAQYTIQQCELHFQTNRGCIKAEYVQNIIDSFRNFEAFFEQQQIKFRTRETLLSFKETRRHLRLHKKERLLPRLSIKERETELRQQKDFAEMIMLESDIRTTDTDSSNIDDEFKLSHSLSSAARITDTDSSQTDELNFNFSSTDGEKESDCIL